MTREEFEQAKREFAEKWGYLVFPQRETETYKIQVEYLLSDLTALLEQHKEMIAAQQKSEIPPAEGAEQAGSEREYPYCPTCGDTIDHGEDYGGYCCTKCRDGHNNDLTARPLNREMKRPNLELEYRFSRNRGCYIHPLTGRSYEDDLEAYINYLTALIRDELIAYDKWCATNYKQPCVNTADRNVDEYLKSRER